MEILEFIDKTPEDNMEWAAQQIMHRFTERQFKELNASFSLLDKALYKGWSKEMTFEELKEAVQIVAELTKK
jgi:HSP20 family molecular chaperone IbpA